MADLPLQNFVDKVTTVPTAWLNEVDVKRALLARNAGGAIIGQMLAAYKATQTARSNNVVLTDDPALIIPNCPAGTWRVSGFLQPQCSITAAQGFQFQVASAAGNFSQVGQWYGVLNAAQLTPTLINGVAPVQQAGNISTALFDLIYFDITMVTTGTGNISLKWSQRSSSANASLLNGGSWITAQALA